MLESVIKFLEGKKQSYGHTSSYLYGWHAHQYRFDTLCSQGVKDEGKAPVDYTDAGEAVENYLQVLKFYLSRDTARLNPVIYWRNVPSLEKVPGGYFVYSRLLVGPEGLQNPETDAPEPIPYLHPFWRTSNKGPNPANNSGFRATGHRILLITEEVEEVTSGGIVLVAKTVVAEANRAQVCTVLEIGPDAWADKSTDYCELGDRVLIGQYVGKMHESPVDGKTYRFVSDLDIISPLPPKVL